LAVIVKRDNVFSQHSSSGIQSALGWRNNFRNSRLVRSAFAWPPSWRVVRLTVELSLYGKVLRALVEIGAPYMVLGGFAARVYGSTRTTHDIDMVVSLEERHIEALANRFPLVLATSLIRVYVARFRDSGHAAIITMETIYHWECNDPPQRGRSLFLAISLL
jgi:hypothetical protein